MRIWYQLLSSEDGMKHSIAATQALANRAAAPGTTVEVRGTPHGALGDNYRLFYHYDTRQVIENGLRIRKSGGYDAFVIGNSLEPGIVELRELLDIPVISHMEVSCFTACTMGERFGLVVPNPKFIPRYREIAVGFGLRDRLAAVESVQFTNIRDYDRVFTDDAVGDLLRDQVFEASRRAIAQGAEVIVAPGPSAALMASRAIYEFEGVPLVDSYSLLVKIAEAMVAMHKLTGIHVSRKLLYQSPPADLVKKAAAAYGIDALRDG